MNYFMSDRDYRIDEVDVIVQGLHSAFFAVDCHEQNKQQRKMPNAFIHENEHNVSVGSVAKLERNQHIHESREGDA